MSSTEPTQPTQPTQLAQPAQPTVTLDIDYWSLKPKVKDIHWSNLRGAYLAHLYDEATGLKGAMKVCMDCITVHFYVGCDGKTMHHSFNNCDVKKPPYHPSYIDAHYHLEPNNKYVQHAILRTHRRKLVPTPPYGILDFRGYDPPEKRHGRHVPTCMLGSSPEYIIQGNGGLENSIYYRRCDGRFRNLAHHMLDIDDAPVNTNRSDGAGAKQSEPEGVSDSLGSVATSLVGSAMGSLKRKRED